MTLIDVTYQPGTQKSPQQTQISMPAFTDTDHIHFPNGRLTTLPPYSTTALTSTYVSLLGAGRSIWAAKLTGTYVGTYTLIGSNTRLYVIKNNNLYNITPLKTSGTSLTDKIATTNTSNIITITQTAHGFAVGDRIKISGASNIGGINANTYINKEHIVATVPTANTYTLVVGTAASSTVAAGGGTMTVYAQISAGNIDQASATGYGVGEYGEGLYGQGGPAVSAQSFPRIWSFGNFGNEIVMCPGDYTAGDGQKIYIWDGNTEIAPTVLTNAPTDCNWVAVVNNSVVAACGRIIKISEIGDATVWSGITYYSKTLERVWKIVAVYNIGDKDSVIFTPTDAFFLRYTGDQNLWDISDLFQDDGIIAPMAAAMLHTVLYWRGARGCYSFDGGAAVKKIENAQNEQWIIDNTNFAQSWKCFALTDTQNGEVYHYFPTGTALEPTDYVIYNPAGHWTLGKMSRTAAQRPNFIDSTFYMINATSASSAGTVYRHFTTGAVTFNWYATTSYSYSGDGQTRYLIDQFIPDSNQSGNITLIPYAKEWPQGSETTFSTYTIASTTTTMSIKAAGRLTKLKLSGSSAATLGAWKMNIRQAGGNNAVR